MKASFDARNIIAGLIVAGLLLLPVFSQATGNLFVLTLFTRIVIFALAAVSLNLIMGYGGMMSFGHAAYLGIGGYAVGILAAEGIGSGFIQWPVALLASALFALVVGALCLRTRIGMLIRAGASNREMIGALGINIKLLYTLVFGLGAALAGLAGLMQAPILTVQIGMGENILILAFVIIVIGGIGSIRGAFVAAILVGMIDTLGRAFLPDLLRKVLSSAAASTAAPALSSMLIYLLMAIVLVVRPEGLFPAARR